MKKRQDNVEFAVFGETSPDKAEVRAVREHSPVHMPAEARLAFYVTLAGLLDGGLSLEEAGGLVVNEYKASANPAVRQSAAAFFEGLSKARTSADMGEVARKAFGRNFVGAEEMVLLRALPSATDKAAVFRAAASIVSLRYGLAADLVPASVARG